MGEHGSLYLVNLWVNLLISTKIEVTSHKKKSPVVAEPLQADDEDGGQRPKVELLERLLVLLALRAVPENVTVGHELTFVRKLILLRGRARTGGRGFESCQVQTLPSTFRSLSSAS